MKVAIDLTSLDDNFSGIERYTLCITKELIKNTSLDFLLVFKNEIKYFESDELAKTNIETKILKGSRLNVLLFLLPKYLNSVSPDVALFFAFPPSFAITLKKSIKVYSTIHDMVVYDEPKTMKLKSRLFFKLGYKYAAKRAIKIFTVSKFSKERIHHYLKRDLNDIFLTYNGCNIPSSFENVDPEVKSKLPKRYLLCLSTLEPRKNFRWVIEQLDSFWKNDNSIPDLVIVGRKGWKVENLLKGISSSSLKRIHFTGFVDDNSLPYVYSNADCFIFPSIYEGFGVPLIESVSFGCLPLCSDIPPSIEILDGNYSHFYKLNDTNDFYDKLKAVLSLNKEQKRSELQPLKNIALNYKWELSASQILDVINRF